MGCNAVDLFSDCPLGAAAAGQSRRIIFHEMDKYLCFLLLSSPAGNGHSFRFPFLKITIMANRIKRGSELNNVKETWEANERTQGDSSNRAAEEVPAASELDRVVREEAAAYDETSNEDEWPRF